YNSGERFPDPACHPGTRIKVLGDLFSWSSDTSLQNQLLWLYGSAGMGKSAIAQTFAGEMQDCSTAWCFFFF
ncbi:hypothetical protein GGX14DRAFT_314376, partial [Mycena pura]